MYENKVVPSQKMIEAERPCFILEYLNHTHDPAFAVHPCPSPIFCHQEDKSELRGATPNFLPLAYATSLHRIGYL